MNPNIANMLSVIPFSPVKHIWFDFSGMDKAHDNLIERFGEKRLADFAQNELVERFPLPFERIAIVIPTTNKKNIPITLERVGNKMTFEFWADGLDEAASTVALEGTIKDMYVFFHPKFEKLIQQAQIHDYCEQHQMLINMVMWGLVAISLNMVPPENSRGYKCVANPKNLQRIKRGKKPLFEWQTIVIERKVSALSVGSGGTHASPKPHDRRGHQRRLKNGTTIYIRPTTINRHKIKTEGFVHHDYRVAV
jgi:hypothetical protein